MGLADLVPYVGLLLFALAAWGAIRTTVRYGPEHGRRLSELEGTAEALRLRMEECEAIARKAHKAAERERRGRPARRERPAEREAEPQPNNGDPFNWAREVARRGGVKDIEGA